jgi:hypothetical protein
MQQCIQLVVCAEEWKRRELMHRGACTITLGVHSSLWLEVMGT